MEEDAHPSPNADVGVLDAPVAGSSAAAATASGPLGSSTGPAAEVRAEDVLGSIRMLKQQQSQLREQRKIVNKQLRNQSKRVSRIRKRARLLTDGDLVVWPQVRARAANPAHDLFLRIYI